MSNVKMNHVRKSYGTQMVLHDFSMDIQDHEFISVIGGSGSGKTTVLKLMNGLLEPDQGTIIIDDKNIAELDQNELRRNIGYVIQHIGLFPHMNIADNIAYVLNLEKRNKIEINERVDELMQIVGLEPSLLTRYPDELSGGQKQRVGIARALAAKPSLLLMDEPFGAVDEITRHTLQNELLAIHKLLPITIFFITHDIQEALRLGTRIMIMKDGAIEQFDTPSEVIAHPATEFVKLLLSYTTLS